MLRGLAALVRRDPKITIYYYRLTWRVSACDDGSGTAAKFMWPLERARRCTKCSPRAEQTAPATPRSGETVVILAKTYDISANTYDCFVNVAGRIAHKSKWKFKRFARIRFPAKFCPAFGPAQRTAQMKSATGTKNAQTIRSGEPIAYSILLFISCGSSIRTSC